jgi:hypothetical protein
MPALRLTMRTKLLDLLWDLQWHEHLELRGASGKCYSARLLELKRLGWDIEDEPLRGSGKRYRLTSREQGSPKGKLVKVYLRERDADRLVTSGEVGVWAHKCIEQALRSFRENKHKL